MRLGRMSMPGFVVSFAVRFSGVAVRLGGFVVTLGGVIVLIFGHWPISLN